MTIKERAKEYAPDPLDPDYILPTREEYIVKQQRQAHIAGASEQRQIDIEKACEWFESYLAEIGYPDDWCRDSEVQESGEKRFRKAMDKYLKTHLK